MVRNIEKIALTVDAVVFTIINNDLKILLIKRRNEPFKGNYALPGGFVNNKENVVDAVKRELEEETGVKNIFLKELKAYSDVGRDPRGRTITTAFLSLISSDDIVLHADTDAVKANWISMQELPRLAFDHDMIVEDALKSLRYEIQVSNIAYQLLPSEFTIAELKKAYELVLGKELDKRNFSKRILFLDILKETKNMRTGGAFRPARLYSFKSKNYSNIGDKVNVFV